MMFDGERERKMKFYFLLINHTKKSCSILTFMKKIDNTVFINTNWGFAWKLDVVQKIMQSEKEVKCGKRKRAWKFFFVITVDD